MTTSPDPIQTENIVLIVEDEPMQRLFVSDLLCDAGYDVVEAGDAPAAFELLENREDVRLVVTDIQMPGAYDGLELAWKVHYHWPHIHLIVTSGGHTPRRLELPGKGRFLPKPFSPGQFFHHFHALIPPRQATA